MALLRVVETDREYALTGKVVLIGRNPKCDIVVNHPGASSRHALIVSSGGEYFVEDLNSVNGTYVGTERIAQRTRLASGTIIELPGLTVTFQEEEARPAGPNVDTVHLKDLPVSEEPAPMASIDIGSELRLTVRPELKLRALLEISKNLGTTLDLKVVLPRTLETLFSIFPQADCGFILLKDPNTGQLAPRAVRHRREPKDNSVPLSRGIIQHVLKTGRAVLSADAGADSRFDTSESISNLKIRSIMCVPIVSQFGKCLGIIQIDTRDRKNQFQEEDLNLLACACGVASRTVELAQLHEQRRDLEAATRIQKSFLPSEKPKHSKLQFFDHYSPAFEVGGDYFDYIPLPGNRLAVALGDVAGKGISAALLMARLSALARFALATAPTIPDAVRQLNRSLIRAGTEELFVTFVVVVLDLERWEMHIVNAGHMPPILRPDGGAPEELGDGIVGLPLAVIDRPYEELVLPMKPGTTLMLYTDGVSEMRNPTNEMFGKDRLMNLIATSRDDAEALGKSVLEGVTKFASDRPQNDDLTIVCFRYKSQAG